MLDVRAERPERTCRSAVIKLSLPSTVFVSCAFDRCQCGCLCAYLSLSTAEKWRRHTPHEDFAKHGMIAKEGVPASTLCGALETLLVDSCYGRRRFQLALRLPQSSLPATCARQPAEPVQRGGARVARRFWSVDAHAFYFCTLGSL